MEQANTFFLSCRFGWEEELKSNLGGDLSDAKRAATLMKRHMEEVRSKLLSTAVRVKPELLPNLAKSFAEISALAGISTPLESYIFSSSDINAFVTPAQGRYLVGLSSGAVNILSQEELNFVIGHELGHLAFSHMDTPTGIREKAELRYRMDFFAWKRACEISADRFGLLCAGSLDVAASAMFRTLSGLSDRSLAIGPEIFAAQWDELFEEVSSSGNDNFNWEMTHPFPPLRMKAMSLYWESDDPAVLRVNGGLPPKRTMAEADKEIRSLLGIVDPLGRKGDGTDPLLANFMGWGGLAIAVSDGSFDPEEHEQIRAIAGEAKLRSLLNGQIPSVIECLEGFKEAIGRRRKLRAVDVRKILTGLLEVAYADSKFTEPERHTFYQIGSMLGIDRRGCDLVADQFARDLAS